MRNKRKKLSFRQLMNLFAIYSLMLMNNAGMMISPAMDTLKQAFSYEPYSKVLLVSTLPALVALPFILISGSIAGTKVRYRTILLAAIPVALVSSVCPFFLKSLTGILICRGIFGVCYGLIGPLCNALILRNYEGEDRVRYLGYTNCVIGVAGVVFQQLGGRLCLLGWNYVFLGHWIFVIPLVLVLFFLIEPPKPEAAPAPAPVKNENALKAAGSRFVRMFPPGAPALFILVASLYMCSQSKMLTLSSIVASEGLGDAATSASILSVATLGAMVGGLLLPHFCRIVKKHRVFVLILILMVMAFGNLVNSAAVIAIAYAVGVMAFMMNLSLVTIRSSTFYPPEDASMAVSLIQCADKFGSFIATYFTSFFAWLVTAAGIHYSIYKASVVATMAVDALLLVYELVRSAKHPELDS